MVSFRNLFLSENQRQVEAEARNIGLAHTIRDLITGSNHETHVDSYQKKQAVKALQKADSAQVNELISILKAMPDPTVVEFKTVHSREPSKHPDPSDTEAPSSSTPTAGSSDSHGEEPGQGSEEGGQDRKMIDPEEETIKAPSSWWAVSFSSLIATVMSSTPSTEDPSVVTTTTTVTTITMTEDEAGPTASALEAAAVAESAAQVDPSTIPSTDDPALVVAVAEIGTEEGKGTITKTTTSSTTVAATSTADKTVLVSTLNSIKQQILALSKAPPTNVISAYTYWWGYEIYVPHKCMSKLLRVTNTSQIFFGFLSGAVTGIPGLAALVPLSRIISAWVGFQWAVIHAEDLGKGVVLSATWVLPVALAPRAWDHPGTEDDPEPEPVLSPKSKQKKIKAA